MISHKDGWRGQVLLSAINLTLMAAQIEIYQNLNNCTQHPFMEGGGGVNSFSFCRRNQRRTFSCCWQFLYPGSFFSKLLYEQTIFTGGKAKDHTFAVCDILYFCLVRNDMPLRLVYNFAHVYSSMSYFLIRKTLHRSKPLPRCVSVAGLVAMIPAAPAVVPTTTATPHAKGWPF